MLPLKIKKKRHECSVKGCKNRANVHIISRTADHTGCIYICDDCLREAYDMIIRAKADNDKAEGAFFDNDSSIAGGCFVEDNGNHGDQSDIDGEDGNQDDEDGYALEDVKKTAPAAAHKAAQAEKKTAARGSRRK